MASIVARFSSKCRQCARPVLEGERVAWEKGTRGINCADCAGLLTATKYAQRLVAAGRGGWLPTKDGDLLRDLAAGDPKVRFDAERGVYWGTYRDGDHAVDWTLGRRSPINGCRFFGVKVLDVPKLAAEHEAKVRAEAGTQALASLLTAWGACRGKRLDVRRDEFIAAKEQIDTFVSGADLSQYRTVRNIAAAALMAARQARRLQPAAS